WPYLLSRRVAVQFAEKPGAVFRGPFGQMSDEGLDQVPAGFADFLGSAEISGVSLDQGRIELVLADQQAESITQPRLAIAGTVPIRMTGIDSLIPGWFWRRRGKPEFFNRTEPDSVRFAQSAIDGSSLGNAHLGSADWR